MIYTNTPSVFGIKEREGHENSLDSNPYAEALQATYTISSFRLSLSHLPATFGSLAFTRVRIYIHPREERSIDDAQTEPEFPASPPGTHTDESACPRVGIHAHCEYVAAGTKNAHACAHAACEP